MMEKSNEIIKQLNRLANDRRLAPNARDRVREAIQHIKDLGFMLKEIQPDKID